MCANNAGSTGAGLVSIISATLFGSSAGLTYAGTATDTAPDGNLAGAVGAVGAGSAFGFATTVGISGIFFASYSGVAPYSGSSGAPEMTPGLGVEACPLLMCGEVCGTAGHESRVHMNIIVSVLHGD